VSESIEQVLRQLIAKELEQTRADDPLVKAVQDLTQQVSALVARMGPGIAPMPSEKRAPAPSSLEIDALQESYRPKDVRLLFVTVHTALATPDASFYLANSHLFRCMRAAFVEAFGPSIPNGSAFLDYFRDERCWLVIVPDEIRRGRGRPPHRQLPDTTFLADLIRDTAPERVIGARRAVGSPLAEAVEAAGFPKDRLTVVRTPRELWKPQFVGKLKRFLATEVAEPAKV
jgi:hypothetical protein